MAKAKSCKNKILQCTCSYSDYNRSFLFFLPFDEEHSVEAVFTTSWNPHLTVFLACCTVTNHTANFTHLLGAFPGENLQIKISDKYCTKNYCKAFSSYSWEELMYSVDFSTTFTRMSNVMTPSCVYRTRKKSYQEQNLFPFKSRLGGKFFHLREDPPEKSGKNIFLLSFPLCQSITLQLSFRG